MAINHYLDGTGAYGGRGEVYFPPSLPKGIGRPLTLEESLLVRSLNATRGRQADGRTVEGLQPWHVSGYVNVASATSIAAKSDIQDMFASSATKLFVSDDTFPWTFICLYFRCSLVCEPLDPATEDAAWQRQLFLRFVTATEVGRVTLPAMACDFVIERPALGAAPSNNFDFRGVATQMNMIDLGVPFRVVFEKNGTYQMFLSTDFGIVTSKPLSFSYQMDGWAVQNTGLLSDGKQIAAVLGNLLGSSPQQIQELLSQYRAYSTGQVPLTVR